MECALRVVKELEIETNSLPGKEGGQATILADLANVIPNDPRAVPVSDIAINYTPRSTIKREFHLPNRQLPDWKDVHTIVFDFDGVLMITKFGSIRMVPSQYAAIVKRRTRF